MKYVLFFAVLASLLLCGCQRSAQDEYHPMESNPGIPRQMVPVSEDGQLLAVTGSREEAEEIAALYGIELVSYQDELAVYHTEDDPQEVIRRGEENGWPALSLNHIRKLY